jgi:hypothetical protein
MRPRSCGLICRNRCEVRAVIRKCDAPQTSDPDPHLALTARMQLLERFFDAIDRSAIQTVARGGGQGNDRRQGLRDGVRRSGGGELCRRRLPWVARLLQNHRSDRVLPVCACRSHGPLRDHAEPRSLRGDPSSRQGKRCAGQAALGVRFRGAHDGEHQGRHLDVLKPGSDRATSRLTETAQQRGQTPMLRGQRRDDEDVLIHHGAATRPEPVGRARTRSRCRRRLARCATAWRANPRASGRSGRSRT